jgi:hypothetical protein
MSVTSGVTKSEALPHLERLGGHRVAGLRARCSPISLRCAGWPPVLCGYRAPAPRRSSFERSLNEVGELRVLLAALIEISSRKSGRLAIAVTVADGIASTSWHIEVI